MKKIINKKNNKHEPWFKWLTRELNSYEAFQDFESGKNPQDVAEDFISRNSTAISEVFENFDAEDKDTLDQFLKLTECEMHVFRILEKQIFSKTNSIANEKMICKDGFCSLPNQNDIPKQDSNDMNLFDPI